MTDKDIMGQPLSRLSTLPRHIQVTAAYERIVDVLLRLKAQGINTDILADAIARAAHEAGIERIK